MFYRILPDDGSQNKLYAAEDVFNKYCRGYGYPVNVRAGVLKKDVEIMPAADLRHDEVKISRNVLEFLSIPSDISYYVRWEENEICFGPVIGLLLAQSNRHFTPKRMEKFLEYGLRYEEIHGLLYVFSLEGIDFDRRCIEGFYYTPDEDGLKPKWKHGVFPFADSVFRRVCLPTAILNKIKDITENRIFNSYFFNKWEFWNKCSGNASVKDNIPATRIFKSFEDIDEMLELYGSVYLKPINGTLGNGLIRIQKKENCYYLQGKFDENPVMATTREEAKAYVGRIRSGYLYIVQQDIKLLKYVDRFVDFRVIMQKDYTRKWNCTGIVACAGAPKGIHSNYINDTIYMSFEDVMTKALSLDKTAAFKKRQDVIELCKKVCRAFDDKGENFGDFGIDVGFDEALKPWVFELNKSQFYFVPQMIGDYYAYYAARTNPVKYAAALSGFGAE